MADITKTQAPGRNADAGALVIWTVATGADQEAAFDEGAVLHAKNTGAGAPTVTVYSAPGKLTGRIDNITAEAIAAGAQRVYGPFTKDGWQQANGKLKFLGSTADISFAILHS